MALWLACACITKSKVDFQPCFILFSIVIIELVSILLILPQRFLYFLKVSSFIASVEKRSFSQLSVSAHSLRAISNFECISARLCGYCASEIFANTLDEDLRSWKTVLELPFMDLQSISHFVASSSEYSSKRFFATFFPFRTVASQSAQRAV